MAKNHKEKTNLYSYTVVFEPLKEGGYNVVVPAISEICTFGKNLAEARKMAQDAIRCYLESIAKERGGFPRDLRRSPQIQRLAVELESV